MDAVQRLNRLENDVLDDPEIATRISAYETAFRMQTSVPDLLDLSDEPEHVFDLYGTRGGDGSFAANCLLARRLAERGVRFIQLYHRDWDHHGALKHDLPLKAEEVDRPAAASGVATSTAPPTSWGSWPSRTRSTSTTCTPRSSTCSASTTPG